MVHVVELVQRSTWDLFHIVSYSSSQRKCHCGLGNMGIAPQKKLPAHQVLALLTTALHQLHTLKMSVLLCRPHSTADG